MSNTINQDQNSPELLELLAAASGAYGFASTISTLQTLAALAVAGMGFISAIWWPDGKAYVGLAGLIVVFADFFVEQWVKHLRLTGAKIQEMFDTTLYHIPWNKLRAGSRIPRETIVANKKRYQKSDLDLKKKVNWYPDITGIPLPFARLICQRANMHWDASLRRIYFGLLVATGVTLIAGGFVLGLIKHNTLEEFIVGIFAPLLPAAVRVGKESIRQLETAGDTDKTKEYLETLWERAVKNEVQGPELDFETRQLQDELFDRRRRSVSVPHLLYKWTKEDYEDRMQMGAKDMATQVRTKSA